MNLLDKIKSILNIDSNESKPANATATTDVSSYESNSSDPSGNGTVDTKPDGKTSDTNDETDAETETETDADDETDTTQIPEVEEAESEPDPSEDGETVVTAGADTESGSETETKTNAGSNAEAATSGVETETETTDTEPAPEMDTGTDTETDAVESEPVDVIKGVGTTYAERLGDVGIETVDELAAADPSALADETDISAKRIERWVGRAEQR